MVDSPIKPMEQFELHKLSPFNIMGIDVSFTTSSLWMVIVAALVLLLMMPMPTQRGTEHLVPGRVQNIREMLYEFVLNMVSSNAGPHAKQYFPFIFTLFMFILVANLVGIVPYTFTITSHIIVTFTLAFVSLLLVVGVGFARHGMAFLKLFVPSGVPFILLPLIVIIEVISYLTRPFSLAIRLFANMLAGHTMLVVFGAFVGMLGVWLGWLPIIFILGLNALEILVAVLQAYVFAILVCIYLGEAVEMKH